MQQDTLYAQSRRLVDAFQFDDDVARVFSDMVRRSVPGYPLLLDILGVIAAQQVGKQAVCYDLGCSLGASTLAIRQNIPADSKVIAIDSSRAMLDRCKKIIAQDNSPSAVEICLQDILTTEFQPCQLVAINLTLQFIPLAQRLPLLKRIADALQKNGVLFLAEKICFEDEETQEKLTELHHLFKKHQGYSDLEVAQKRAAIENVLIPETITAHKQRLFKAGFRKVLIAMQSFNFVALLAYK